MKQKIVMEVQMCCDKCRTKAMKIAAVTDGVISVALEGPEKNKVVVIGDGIDSASLANSLKKKVGYTSLISVEEVKPKPEEEPKPEEKPEPEEKVVPIQCCSSYIQYPPRPTYDYVYYDHPNRSGCSIM